MNLQKRNLLSLLFKAAFFVATFLTFSVLAFVATEIALFVFVTASNYQFASSDSVFMAVCAFSLISSFVVTTIIFLRQVPQRLFTGNTHTND